jgi:hypothetical protein
MRQLQRKPAPVTPPRAHSYASPIVSCAGTIPAIPREGGRIGLIASLHNAVTTGLVVSIGLCEVRG